MVIHSIRLFLRDKQAEGAPFNFQQEFVGVNFDAVCEEADRMIAHWLAHGYAEGDYLAMTTSGASYRYERVPAIHYRVAPFRTACETGKEGDGFSSDIDQITCAQCRSAIEPMPESMAIGEIAGRPVVLRRLDGDTGRPAIAHDCFGIRTSDGRGVEHNSDWRKL